MGPVLKDAGAECTEGSQLQVPRLKDPTHHMPLQCLIFSAQILSVVHQQLETTPGASEIEDLTDDWLEDHMRDVIGNVDSGKSTLVGVLTKGGLDDGRGLARAKVFNFSHEAANGRTSSIAQARDLCGHEKYLKTTIFGLVGQCTDTQTLQQ
eukprot:Skav233602  [mRNA]  locus=scaffold109:27742:30640:+ [translate_table: standard]